MRQLGRLDDAREGVGRVAQADVRQHRVGEDQVGLEDHGDLGANRVEGRLAEVRSVDPDAARLGVDQPRDQAGQRELRVLLLAEQGRTGPTRGSRPRRRPAGRGRTGSRATRARARSARWAARGSGREHPGAARAFARGTRRCPRPTDSPAGSPCGSRIYSDDRVGQARQRDEEDQHRADGDLLVDEHVISQQPEGQRRSPRRRAGSCWCSMRPAGDHPPVVGLLEPLEVLVEPLAVVLLDAVDADRAEQAQVLVQQDELDRGIAHARRRRPAGRRSPYSAPSARPAARPRPGRSSGSARPGAPPPAGRRPRTCNPRREVQVGEETVADVVDLARPEIDHRPDALGRQRRLAQPVHLAMDLPAHGGGDIGGRPGDRPSAARSRRSRSGPAGSGPSPAASRAHPGCSASVGNDVDQVPINARPRTDAPGWGSRCCRGSMGRSPCHRTGRSRDPLPTDGGASQSATLRQAIDPARRGPAPRPGRRSGPRTAPGRPAAPRSAATGWRPESARWPDRGGSSGGCEPDGTRLACMDVIPGFRGQGGTSTLRRPLRRSG